MPLALLSLIALLPAAQASVFPVERVQIQADEISYDSQAGLSHATGHVLVTTPELVLRAPAATDDTRSQRLTVEGPLFAVDGLNVILARRAVMNLETNELVLFDFVLHQKERVSAAALAKAQTGAEAAALGPDHAVISGKQLTRLGPAHYRIDGLELTPCQCAGGCTPAWSMTAAHGDVVAGERALLTWPVFRVAEIPLVPLPALYVPLADRRTGFLLPHLNWQRQNGLLVDEPFFLTLGRSADVTITAGFITGETESGWGASGVYGPRASLELRYAPNHDTEGRIFASVLDDLHHDFDQNGVGYVRGPRESVHLWHLQGDLDDGGRWGDRADISLVTDARLTGQMTTDILFASIPATRSAADAFWRGDDWLVALDAVFYQDFQGYFADTNVHELLFGPGSPATLATAPRLQADFDDRKLGPVPIWFSLQSSLAHEAALGPAYDRITLGPSPTATTAGAAPPGTLLVAPSQPGRAAVDHLDLFPSLTLPLVFGRFATASVKASWREDLWSFEANPDPAGGAVGQGGESGQRGYPLLDADVGTRLSRSWISGWSHSIAPQVEARYLPWIETSGVIPPLWLVPTAGSVFDHATGLPFAHAIPLPYDERDFAPGYGGPPVLGGPGIQRGTLPTGFAQGALHIDQRLRGPSFQARLDLGEYVDEGGFEATYGLLQSTFGQFRANGYALFSNQPAPCPGCTSATAQVRRLEEATADVGWADPRGDSAGVSFVRALAAGSAILNSPVDALFAPPLPANDLRWTLPDVSQAAAYANARVWDGIFVHAGMTYLVPAETPIQILAGAGYHSSQNCLVLDANLVLQPPQAGSPLTVTAFFVTFDLGEIAGGGSL